jgi:hypothetical protein
MPTRPKITGAGPATYEWKCLGCGKDVSVELERSEQFMPWCECGWVIPPESSHHADNSSGKLIIRIVHRKEQGDG